MKRTESHVPFFLYWWRSRLIVNMIKDQRWLVGVRERTTNIAPPHGNTTNAGGGEGGRKDPNGLTFGSTGLSFSCMDLVDPKLDFLLTLNDSVQSLIAACISSPPPPSFPHPNLKHNRGDWGEKVGLAACITGVTVFLFVWLVGFFFFLQEGDFGGCPKPWYRVNSSKTEIRRKISLKAHVAGKKTFEKRADAMCFEHPAYIIKTLWSPLSLLRWTIGHLRQSFGVKSSYISNWHITWLCLSNRGTTNASSPRCRCSKREIGGQLTLVATRNLIWVACVWQILIVMLQNLVSLRRIYSLQASPSVRWFYGFPSQELEVANYKKSNGAFLFHPLRLRGTSCVSDCHA